jgi:hypothetical protein
VTARTLALAAATAVGLAFGAAAAPPAAHARRAPAGEAAGDDAWRAVLDRAVEASRASAYEGRLVIVGFGQDGPNLAEVDIAQGSAGGLRVGRAEAWMVGRQADDSFYWEPEAGTLLRLGSVERPEFSIAALTRKYVVEAEGSTELRTGPALVLTIRERASEHPRERLYVDDATGLVVRRDTFRAAGEPSRVVAFTKLEVTELSISAPEGVDATTRGVYQALEEEGLRILGEVGWAVPDELPGGFALRMGYALPESDGSSLHLVYSDGLYTLSVYQQFGLVDTTALGDAASVVDGGTHVYRWPGSEPERMVWTGEGKTFTAISDAPYDQVLGAVAGLPNEIPGGVLDRMKRGVGRVATWLWPFD